MPWFSQQVGNIFDVSKSVIHPVLDATNFDLSSTTLMGFRFFSIARAKMKGKTDDINKYLSVSCFY